MPPPIRRAQDQLFDRSRSAREKYADLVVGQPGWGALAWHEFVTVVAIFHLPLLRVVREADVVVRGKQQACAFAFEPLANRLDFGWLGFLFGDEVVQAEYQQCVRVGQHAFVNRQLVAGLINTLKNGDWVSGHLTDDLLK